LKEGVQRPESLVVHVHDTVHEQHVVVLAGHGHDVELISI
jgi:hypothetical protein